MKLGKVLLMFFVLTSLLVSKNDTAHAAGGGIPILLYHHILKKSENHDPSNLNIINLEAFEEQMNYLKEQGYYTATLSELDAYMQGTKALPVKTVVITFDDGHKTNYTYAYPVLKKYGLKANAFLITNRISDTPVSFDPTGLQFLSWPEIAQMKDVFQFGSHTDNLHYTSNGKAAVFIQPEDIILKDFQTSRGLLNTVYFAYPFGAYNQRTIELLKTAGYKYAFTTVATNAVIGNNPYQIGRKGVFPTTSLASFKEMVKSTGTSAGWKKIDNNWYFMDENGIKKTGWLQLGSRWYYLDSKGVMKTGWMKVGACWYYIDSSGAMKTGWLKLGTTWYYLTDSGAMKTGWLSYQGKWYYLESSGSMRTGWILSGGKWYYLDSSGSMEIGWQTIKGKTYFLDNNGAMKTGWMLLDGKWYYFDANGSMKTGWVLVKDQWYYLESDGILKTGWLDLSGSTYYLNTDGAMVTGWIQLEENWYYFYSNGLMARNTEVDGYQIGEDGKRIVNE